MEALGQHHADYWTRSGFCSDLQAVLKNAHEIFEQNCLNCRYAYSVRGNIKVDFRMRHKDRLSFALGVSHAGARSEIPLCGTSAGVPAPTPLPTWHG